MRKHAKERKGGRVRATCGGERRCNKCIASSRDSIAIFPNLAVGTVFELCSIVAGEHVERNTTTDRRCGNYLHEPLFRVQVGVRVGIPACTRGTCMQMNMRCWLFILLALLHPFTTGHESRGASTSVLVEALLHYRDSVLARSLRLHLHREDLPSRSRTFCAARGVTLAQCAELRRGMERLLCAGIRAARDTRQLPPRTAGPTPGPDVLSHVVVELQRAGAPRLGALPSPSPSPPAP